MTVFDTFTITPSPSSLIWRVKRIIKLTNSKILANNDVKYIGYLRT